MIDSLFSQSTTILLGIRVSQPLLNFIGLLMGNEDHIITGQIRFSDVLVIKAVIGKFVVLQDPACPAFVYSTGETLVQADSGHPDLLPCQLRPLLHELNLHGNVLQQQL